jgi:23S rRNA pseudouridine1911/1915/1917 synthase
LKQQPTWVVSPDDAGVSLDRFLADPSRLGSRRRATAEVERGRIFVNDREMARADLRRELSEGDRVRAWLDRPGTSRRPKRARDGLTIVYEDDAMIVVDKPAGLLTVPLVGDRQSVYDRLMDRLRSRGKRKPLVVHRIDRDTSGLVVFATRADAQQRLRDQFRRREAGRVYLAVIYGCPSPRTGTWRDHLVWDQKALIQKETHPRDPRGKEAISNYRVVEAFDQVSLIEVTLVTGKRNQIRLQARLHGHTLVGEQRYVYGPDHLRPIPFPRQALHALRLALKHPRTGRPMQFEAPIPADLRELLVRLRSRDRRAGPDRAPSTSKA